MAEINKIIGYFIDPGIVYNSTLYQIPAGEKHIRKTGNPANFSNYHIFVDNVEWAHPPQAVIDEVINILDQAEAAGNSTFVDIVALVSPIIGTDYTNLNGSERKDLLLAVLHKLGAIASDGSIKTYTEWELR